MGDRRISDRREKESGVIKIKFKTAAIILIIFIIFLLSFSANIVLFIKNKQYKEDLNYYQEAYYDLLNSDYSDLENIDEDNSIED